MTDETRDFDPSDADPRDLRDALGRFVTGVTVVTCNTPDGPVGITANSFASVSLDPPLVLWSPAKNSQRYPFFMAADHFAIHVLLREQVNLCHAFSRSADGFAAATWHEGPHGVPLLEGCAARFLCEKAAEHDGGDHSILIGHVLSVSTKPGAPLTFNAGAFGGFIADS
ncbi:flavin oxidoreductase [Salipiger pallidus]|uniref:Flavin oxidoreductase n=1 Tax=Salipiger pallidus TaxID=1775170 RepID=A0A8J2ZK11_9RHOB|nr:flavin reductase family protein [Salipiger pallidus]GGG71697.1 flavin oxidoreductase [Salipiger pallidus]